MRRADRLFQIVQLLRHDRAITARALAQSLAVSERTIYRDVQDLSLCGVPIEGAAGVGYRMMSGFHLPPLMFNEEELAALLLGTRMVRAWTDPGLAQAADQVLRKIEAVLPARLKPELAREELMVPAFLAADHVCASLAVIRAAIKTQRKLNFHYRREDGRCSNRVAHPLGLFYWGKVWTLVAWCELREDFRHFRVDRMDKVETMTACFETTPGRTLQDFLATVCDDA